MSQNPTPAGVTVTIPAGSRTEDVEHKVATGIEVSEGHLMVKKSLGSATKTIAIYAPGKWQNAVINYAS